LSKESLEIFRRTVGNEHPAVARGMSNLATWQMEKNDYASAEPLLREALKMRARLLSPEHTDVAQSMTLLAYLLAETGRFEDALPLARNAGAIYQQSLPADHWRIASAASAEGAALAGLKRYDEAEPLLIESYMVLSDDTAALPFFISLTRYWLVELYVQTGRPAEAERYRRTQGKP
jgi:tetratricopeptide (TPR) repeat protein